MQDTSSIGVHVRIKASKTYPNGITIRAFPEDGDVGTTGETDIASSASGVNGDLIVWSTVNGIEVSVPVIPNTPDSELLDRLYQANRPSVNHFPAKDRIQMVVTNPVTGVAKTYKNGYIRNGNVGKTYGGDGRIRTLNYGFTFEDAV